MNGDLTDIRVKSQWLTTRAQLFEKLRRAISSEQVSGVRDKTELMQLIRTKDESGLLEAEEINQFHSYLMVPPEQYQLARRHLIQRLKFEEDSEKTRLSMLLESGLARTGPEAAKREEASQIEQQIAESRTALKTRHQNEIAAFHLSIGVSQERTSADPGSEDELSLAMELLDKQRMRKHVEQVNLGGDRVPAGSTLARKRIDASSSASLRIFISCVSTQLKECRDALASDLRAIGNQVHVQEDFRQGPSTLLTTLQHYVSSCDRLIALVGNAYGLEPPPGALPKDKPIRSYTQWEYFFALGERIGEPMAPRKDIYVYIASEEFLAGHRVEQSAEHSELQRLFLVQVKGTGEDRRIFDNVNQLCRLVLRDGWQLGERPRKSRLSL